MTVELIEYISNLGEEELKIVKPKDAFARTSYKPRDYQRESSGKEDDANVFRGPKVVHRLTSNPERCYLRRTKMPFSCDGYRTRCYGLLRDPVGRAICERCLAIGYLGGWVRLDSQR